MSDVGDRLPGYDSATGDPVSPSRGWQPIETAPKDGRLILLYMPGGVCIAPAENWARPSRDVVRMLVRETKELPDYQKWTPTHWMPLPPPPVSA